MEIRFHGACRTVTGSCHQVMIGGKNVLLDAGLFQGPRAEARKINCCFDFDPKSVDMVILSHAHQDHCGNLPNLVKQGFSGPIYCTKATAAIGALMLLDSAKIQEEDAAYLNKKAREAGTGGAPHPQVVPLYMHEDAEKVIGLFEPVEYRKERDLGGFTVELHDAGHVLGAAAVKLRESSTGRVLVFTGDVGRPGSPILRDPEPFGQADAVISECTYGGRTHAPISEAPKFLARVINETAGRGGILMVPAFALGRTQVMLEVMDQLRVDGKISGKLPIFVDSPLATRITEVHRQFSDLFDEEAKALTAPFDFPGLTYVGSPEESRRLNGMAGPFIVIASSGMCEAGRILHHLKHHIADSKNTVLLPGYQAVNTLGRRIQERERFVRILGDMIPLRAHVEQMDGLSAHADGGELVQFTLPLKGAKVYLVHGEVERAEAHRGALEAGGFATVTIATRGECEMVNCE